MPNRRLSRSAPPTNPATSSPELEGTPTNTSTPPAPLSRLFSGQHLDDLSHYKDTEHDSRSTTEHEDEEANEKSLQKDDDQIPSEAAPEVRMGVQNERDLEANALEKKQSTKSVKDPNLVRQSMVSCPHARV